MGSQMVSPIVRQILRRVPQWLTCAVALLAINGASAAIAQEGMSPEQFAMLQKYASIQWESGPYTGQIGNHAEIKLPAGFAFTGAQGAQDLLEVYGNPRDTSILAAIVPEDENADWTLVFQFDDIGYVDDSDRDSLDAEALISAFREGIPASNRERRAMGLEELQGMAWQVPPFYDPQTNNLTWGLKLDFPSGSAINYDIRILGRRGVMQATLLGDPETYAAALPQVKTLLANYAYLSGNKYAEWSQGDKVAGVGLAGLVAGGGAVVAAKTGLLAKLGLIFAKGGKAIIIGVIVLFATVGSFLKRLIFGESATSS